MRTGQINGRDKLVCETYKIAFEYALKLYIKLKKDNMNIKAIIKEVDPSAFVYLTKVSEVMGEWNKTSSESNKES